MPIRHTPKGWYWGSKGPFPTRAKAVKVAQAAHASGFKEKKGKKHGEKVQKTKSRKQVRKRRRS